MINKNHLKSLGLTGKELEVFHLCLKEGEITINSINRVLKINRVSIYHYISKLEDKFLINKKTVNGKLSISLANKESIYSYLTHIEKEYRDKKSALDEIIKNLPRNKAYSYSNQDVEYFKGEDGVMLAIQKALNCKTHRWYVTASKRNFFTHTTEQNVEYYLSERKRRKIISETIWEHSPKKHPYSKDLINERNPRMLPQKYALDFECISIIFDQSVLFISSKNYFSAVIINSFDIYNFHKKQFDILYDISTSIDV